MDNERPMDDERPRETIESDLADDDIRGFGWRKLLATAFAFSVLGNLAIFFLSFEPIFLVTAGVGAVGLILSRIKRRLAGVLGIIIILAVGFFSWFLAFSLVYPAAVFEFSSALLAVLGIVFGLIAAIGSIAKPRGPSGGAKTLAFLMIILLVAGLGYSVYSFSTIESDTAEDDDLQVTMADFEFDPQSLEADEGDLGVFLTNDDNFTHSFTIDELDVNLFVEPGVSKRVTFEAEPGTYKFYCIPHTEMTGELTVED